MVEILDGPPEWAGAVYETDEDMVADEIGMSHPDWRGTRSGSAGRRCMPTARGRWSGTGTATATWDPGAVGIGVSVTAGSRT